MAEKRNDNGQFAKGNRGGPGRPRKRPRAEPRADALDGATAAAEAVGVQKLTLDGFKNALTGLSQVGVDKRLNTEWETLEIITDEMAEDLWRGNDIAARAIETWPDEMLRPGWRLELEGDDDRGQDIQAQCEDLGVDDAILDVLKWERAKGGGALLLGVNDGATDLRTPLNWDRIRSLDWITPLEKRELCPLTYQANPRMRDFGKPVIWQISPYHPGVEDSPEQRHETGIEVHASRLLVAPGIQVSRNQKTDYPGFGDSVLTRLWGVLRDFGVSWDSVGVILNEYALGVYKIKDLTQLFATDSDSAVLKRFEALQLGRSVLRGMVLDANEDFSRVVTPLTGIPEILDRFESRLAAAVEMPITILMGRSPGGLNATGESDMRIFYDRVDAKRQKKLKTWLEYIVKILLKINGGEPENWEVCFSPLWQPTGKERAEERLIVAQTDKVYVDAGIVTPEEVAQSRWGEGRYSPEMSIDFDDRGEYEQMKDDERAQLEASLMPPDDNEPGDESDDDGAN